MAVWLLTGLWHGAAWNFVLWGFYFFVLLMIEKFGFAKILEKIPAVWSHLYTLFFVNISWVIFSHDTLTDLGKTGMCMLGLGGIPFWNNAASYYWLSYLPVLVIMAVAATPYPKRAAAGILKKMPERAGRILGVIAETAGILFVLWFATGSLVSDAFNPFLYFRF